MNLLMKSMSFLYNIKNCVRSVECCKKNDVWNYLVWAIYECGEIMWETKTEYVWHFLYHTGLETHRNCHTKLSVCFCKFQS